VIPQYISSRCNYFLFGLQKLKSELPKVEKQLETAKKQLEDETIQRVDLQNRVQSLKEELAFKDEIHGQVNVPIYILHI